ncbi:PREDICTED: sentrin-specific protease 8-like isoform X2 [Branchiostoma belcheri]|uniref:Sentrin-specific protease 8-like isoform X2 n=1 Tax=Branchiostoma belcheri TaxID=7741 RepID=A0A6P4YVY2_BRABE|nr:PREDICTED: sentrin-specific protease 8-like isoform X2 [Branchiostoma belcheri]
MAELADDIVLSFHDSCLRNSDVRLLQPPNWLNDKILGFAFEYFERVQFEEFSSDVTFISPDVTQFIKYSQGDDLAPFLEPLELSCKKYIFLAVNDNSNIESTGGSHWSLLLYRRDVAEFQHYDSSHGSGNTAAAKLLVKRVQPFLGGYDCGVYVISNTEHLCRQLLQGDSSHIKETVTSASVKQKRKQLQELIRSLGR